MIKGIDIKVYTKTVTGVDALNAPTYTWTEKTVSNVIVAPSTDTEILETTSLYGRKCLYTLAIPKGDNTSWVGAEVMFFGQRYRVIGCPLEGIESLIPLDWNKKVRVELVDGN